MTRLRPALLALALSAVCVPNASAIVGGTNVPAGQRGYVAYIEIDGSFACTGTLVTPTRVVTAGHCSAISGAVTPTPVISIAQPPQLISVTLGSVKRNDPAGEKPGVKSITVHPKYTFENGSGYDVAVLELARPSVQAPVKIAAPGEENLWKPGTLAQIAGFGTTKSEGDAPDTMQQAQVPIVSDATAKGAYPDSFEAATQIGAGYPQGGTDSCQGDSGGPLLVSAADGSLRLVGDTSYGNGCAQPGFPGIYGRVAGSELRPFVTGAAPGSSAPAPAGAPATAPVSGAPTSKKKVVRRKSCASMHRASKKHNRGKRHKREVKRCLARRRAKLSPR